MDRVQVGYSAWGQKESDMTNTFTFQIQCLLYWQADSLTLMFTWEAWCMLDYFLIQFYISCVFCDRVFYYCRFYFDKREKTNNSIKMLVYNTSIYTFLVESFLFTWIFKSHVRTCTHTHTQAVFIWLTWPMAGFSCFINWFP